MPKNKSLIRQVKETLNQKLRIGEKKHIAKQAGTASDGIYSWGTYNTYLAKGCNFVKWAKEYHESNGDINDGSNDDNNDDSNDDVNDDNSDDCNSDGNGGSNTNGSSNGNSKCRTLADVRKYVNPYIQHLIDRGYTPSTQKTIASALAKLYGCSTKDFIPTQDRRRVDITRSRLGKANEGFSESNNREFVEFCRATGLRRSEVKHLRPENLRYDESTGRYGLVDVKGKGGRLRGCPIIQPAKLVVGNGFVSNGIIYSETINDEAVNSENGAVEKDIVKLVVERMLNTPNGQLVWDKVPSRADIHSYRADYCKTIYNLHARPVDEIPRNERYYCRGDRKGIVYDRRAMAVASRVLGHNRISVIAGHYLYERAGGINFLPTANK